MKSVWCGIVFLGTGLAGGWLLRGVVDESASEPLARTRRSADLAHEVKPRSARAAEPLGEKVGEAAFVEAVSADAFRRERAREVSVPTVEEVKGADGLTVDERKEKFRREHPDEWAALERRRAGIRAAREAAAARQQEILSSVNTEFFTSAQRERHAAYADAFATRQVLLSRLRNARLHGEVPSPVDVEAFRRVSRTLREQASSERTALLEGAARSFGADVKEFTATIESILTVTDVVNDVQFDDDGRNLPK